ncbi:MAG TPA: four helix bundle protein [Terriglobales bacterium]|nr:four helix bundle protein [Terriglobales bacterium]
MALHSYEDLIAWQKAVDLVAEVYRATKSFPRDEVYGLTAQLRRAAVSIPSNIAEGQGRLSTGEFKQFLGHARGSLYELNTQLRIAEKLKYLSRKDADALTSHSAEVGRILNGLMSSLGDRGASETNH